MFKKSIIFLSVLFFSTSAFSWGKTGHRVIGEIAQRNLSSEAKKGVTLLLGSEDLARVSTWADEIRSIRKYDYAAPWHYSSIPTGKTYFDQKRSKDGDVIESLFRFEETLRDSKKSKSEKAESLKFLVHMMGDLHQPLHVGIAEDRGGNTVKVKWFKNETNLHALWDESIVDFEQFSYSEYANQLNHFSKDEKTNFVSGTFLDWARESMDLRTLVYDVGTPESVGYEYHHKIKPAMELRMRQAGLRLAHILNRVFKNEKVQKDYSALSAKVKENI